MGFSLRDGKRFSHAYLLFLFVQKEQEIAKLTEELKKKDEGKLLTGSSSHISMPFQRTRAISLLLTILCA